MNKPASCLLIAVWSLLGAIPEQAASAADPAFVSARPQEAAAIADIEAAIHQLEIPADQERVRAIVAQLARFEDPEAVERLERQLKDRLAQHALEADANASVPHEGIVLSSEEANDPTFLRLSIVTLRLGPDATMEDLRKRDVVISRIAQISDPRQQRELLRLLDKQERLRR